MSNTFSFKQFSINQDGAAMKLGIDSVLLGAWTSTKEVQNVLDIGSGTGILSLMIAQRNSTALIDSVEIDESAFRCSIKNFESSPFSERLRGHHIALQNFTPTTQFDLIISNPPYFCNGTKAANSQRQIARHDDSLSLSELFKFAACHLKEQGHINLILPWTSQEQAIAEALHQHLYPHNTCTIIPKTNRPANRIILSFGFEHKNPKKDTITLRDTNGSYSKAFIELSKDYYLSLS